MARPLRIQYPGAFYHVMNRGAERKSIFYEPIEDRALFLKTLGEAAHLWKIRVHAYSLMDNHYHLLIETPLANLSRAMRHLDGVFTQRFNRKTKRDGALFRGRFKSILVQKESYFLELVRYIHLNGVKALRYSSPSLDPHCSHGAYLNAVHRPVWLTTELALSFFESNGDRFDEYICAGIPETLETMLSRKRWPAILGAQQFIDDLRRRFRLNSHPHREKPQEKDLIRNARPDPARVVGRVAEIFGMEESVLRRRSSKKHGRVQQVAVYVLRYACHCRNSEIGTWLGGMSDSAVSYCLRQFKARGIAGNVREFLEDEFGLVV